MSSSWPRAFVTSASCSSAWKAAATAVFSASTSETIFLRAASHAMRDFCNAAGAAPAVAVLPLAGAPWPSFVSSSSMRAAASVGLPVFSSVLACLASPPSSAWRFGSAPGMRLMSSASRCDNAATSTGLADGGGPGGGGGGGAVPTGCGSWLSLSSLSLSSASSTLKITSLKTPLTRFVTALGSAAPAGSLLTLMSSRSSSASSVVALPKRMLFSSIFRPASLASLSSCVRSFLGFIFLSRRITPSASSPPVMATTQLSSFSPSFRTCFSSILTAATGMMSSAPGGFLEGAMVPDPALGPPSRTMPQWKLSTICGAGREEAAPRSRPEAAPLSPVLRRPEVTLHAAGCRSLVVEVEHAPRLLRDLDQPWEAVPSQVGGERFHAIFDRRLAADELEVLLDDIGVVPAEIRDQDLEEVDAQIAAERVAADRLSLEDGGAEERLRLLAEPEDARRRDVQLLDDAHLIEIGRIALFAAYPGVATLHEAREFGLRRHLVFALARKVLIECFGQLVRLAVGFQPDRKGEIVDREIVDLCSPHQTLMLEAVGERVLHAKRRARLDDRGAFRINAIPFGDLQLH